MNQQQAKQILSLYRPGTDDSDASFAEARRLCDRDSELNRWFENHCEVYLALRSKFKATAVPEGLKEQILAERKVHTTPLPMMRRRPVLLVAAAVALAVFAGLVFSLMPPREDVSFAAYRQRMISTALRDYVMDLETNDLAAIREFFAQRNANASYLLPEALQQNAQPVGCVLTHWQNKSVTMICFKSGKPLPPGQASDVWLFVISRDSLPNAPASSSPSIAEVNVAAAASWSSGDKTYVLAVDGDETLLRKFL